MIVMTIIVKNLTDHSSFDQCICNGLRPGFAPGTPDCYIQLAKQCMDTNPEKRPTAYKICEECCNWMDLLGELNEKELNKEEVEIRNAFLAADKIIPTLSTVSQRHSNAIYISRFIDTQKILKTYISKETIDTIGNQILFKLKHLLEVLRYHYD